MIFHKKGQIDTQVRTRPAGEGGAAACACSRCKGVQPVPLHPVRVQFLPDPFFRARSVLEPTPYLDKPVFSSCTVPIVMYPFWLENYFHTTGLDFVCTHGMEGVPGCPRLPRVPRPAAAGCPPTASRRPTPVPPTPPALAVWAAFLNWKLNNATWRPHAKVVLATGEGLRLPTMVQAVAQPLSNLSVETLADFSSRLIAGVRTLPHSSCGCGKTNRALALVHGTIGCVYTQMCAWVGLRLRRGHAARALIATVHARTRAGPLPPPPAMVRPKSAWPPSLI